MAPLIIWIYFLFTHMRLSALRKLIFGVHGVQEMFFRSAKKNSVHRLNFETKVLDNILK